MRDAPPELIIVGRVRKAHGVRGDLVVEPLSDEADAVFAVGRRVVAGTITGDAATGRPELHIASATPFKGGFIVHFDEITDRDAADVWRERFLLLPADELTPPADGQVYLHELNGMRVELESGEAIGTVVTIYELPQGITLDVERGAGKGSVLVPYDRVVTSVDRDARVIRIAPPAGLLD
ncbi:MAG TPA: ribosome maturation factor RimM [Gemmatimonadaceae bacterium]|nr:ribosome maturation factor RimM [Gemmatimonadaceae bacterium]